MPLAWLLTVGIACGQVDDDSRYKPRLEDRREQGTTDATAPAETGKPPSLDLLDPGLSKPPEALEGPSDPSQPLSKEDSDSPRAAEPEPPAPPAGRGASPDSPPAASQPGQPLADIKAQPQKLRPPELLADALATPEQDGLTGSAMPLVDVLRGASGRAKQIRAIHAYWKLSAAQARHHFAGDSHKRLTEATRAHQAEAAVRGALAASEARAHDAHAAVLETQHELVTHVGSREDGWAPLASDRPHVGAYDTKFQQIFSGQTPPAELLLIDRMLPVRRKAIDLHAASIQAAIDAFEAVAEDYGAGRGDLAPLLASIEQLSAERENFLTSVRRYNQQIADYALALAPSSAPVSALVPRLIRAEAASQTTLSPKRPPSGDPRSAPGGVRPAPRQSPIPSEQRANPTDRSASRRSRSMYLAAQVDASTPAGADADPPQAGDYQGILTAAPSERLLKLSELLNWDRNPPAGFGQPIQLTEALVHVAPADRLSALRSYWQARELAARYQALQYEVDQLSLLSSMAIEARGTPAGPSAMLRLRAMRQAAQAHLRETEAQLIEASFVLMRHVGHPMQQPWRLPKTPPRATAHEVQRPGEPNAGAPAPLANRRIDQLYKRLEQQAAAVVLFDAARAEQTARAPSDSVALERAIAAIGRQHRETLEILAALTDYNEAIAMLVLDGGPKPTSPEELVRLLGISEAGA